MDYVKIKLRRNSTSEKLEKYALKMALSDNVETEELLFFVKKFKMMIEAPGGFVANTKLQHLRTVLCGETLHALGTLCIKIESTTITHLNQVIFGLGT